MHIFSLALMVLEFFTNFVTFPYTKHIWEPCYHLAAETGRWFSLVTPACLALGTLDDSTQIE